MPLEERLATIRAASKERIPAEARAIMQQSTEDLRRSGILERVVKAGSRAPGFTLPDTEGRPVALQDVLARGPAVLSFYRGRW